MSNNDPFENVEKILKEVCELTSDKCNGAFDKFKQNPDKVDLIEDVFDSIRKIDEPNLKKEVFSKLNKLLKNPTSDDYLSRMQDFSFGDSTNRIKEQPKAILMPKPVPQLKEVPPFKETRPLSEIPPMMRKTKNEEE